MVPQVAAHIHGTVAAWPLDSSTCMGASTWHCCSLACCKLHICSVYTLRELLLHYAVPDWSLRVSPLFAKCLMQRIHRQYMLPTAMRIWLAKLRAIVAVLLVGNLAMTH